MKTISVIFTKEKQAVPTGKKYSYNTESDVKEGDLVEIEGGKTIQIVKVFDTLYTHFDFSGKLYESNHPNAKGELKEIVCKVIEN